jgi:TonB-dependent starch-binding outer membrane protein SusC
MPQNVTGKRDGHPYSDKCLFKPNSQNKRCKDMKKCLLKHVIYMTKLFTLAFTLQCLSMSLLLAWNGNAQVKSIEEVSVHLSLNEVKVEKAFKALERITEFNFVFASREVSDSPLISVDSHGESMYDLLVSIATQSNLSFKQVDGNIHVKKTDKENLIVVAEIVDITISGTVTDENGEPLPGATISVLGTSIGTVSDIDGQYSITVPEGATVVYSYIGYESKSIEVGTQNLINVTLVEDQSSLEEVVVVGYGTVKKSDLTGSVASVSSEEIKDMALTSLEQGLQGRAAGVQVTQASGEPGGMSTIRIRGGNSLQGGNEPLYVIDGFPIYNGGGTNRPGTGANLNPLASINPSDIESMEILKDASATAIYGSRGANGVVLITTKGGQKGKDVISFESYYGIQEVRKKIDLMNANQLGELVNEAYVNDGLAPVFTDAEISSFGEGTDWQDEIFRQAPIQNHQLSFSGGDEKTTYSISGNYFDQKGIIINSDFTRYSGRVNVNRSVNQNLNIGTHLTVNRSVNNTIRSSTDGGGGTGVVLGALMMSPIQSVYQDEENSQYTLINDRGILVPNPVATAREIQNELITTRLLGDLYAEYQITDNLSAKVSFGADVINSKGNYYVPSYIVQGTGEGGIGNVNAMMSTTWLNENTLSYNKQLPNNNSINAVVGITFQGHRTEFIEASSQGFVSDELRAYSLQSGSVYNQPVTNAPEWGLVSYLGRLNYNIKDKYLFTFTGRIDGSSRFGEGNKYGYFPSGAFAWRLSDEGFIQNLGIFDDLKLRTSFGITGNQEIGQYNALATMVSDTYTFNDNLVTGFRPNRVPNPMLQWEKTNQFDFGIDFGFFDNRLRLTTDYYHKITTDLLFSANIPWSSGFNSGLQNIGSVENRGVEISLGSDILTGEFVWTSNFNLAFNRNKILDLGEVDFFFAGGSSGHLKIDNVSRVEVGRPVGTFYGYVFDGIFQNEEEVTNSAQPNAQPGERRFRDLNEDGVITPEGDRTYLGNAQPKFFGGLTNNFNYKGFELNIFTQWSYGNDILNYNRFELEAPTGDQNIASYMTERWTPSNPSTIYPRASRARTVFFSDRQLEDGSYLRIKTLTLAYTFPNLKSSKISGLRLYFTGQNFLTWTNYSGFDPEVSRYGATNLNLGEDYGVYPVSKSFILGCNFTLK